MNTQSTNRRRDACSLRIKNDDIVLIDRAASARGMTRADFIVVAAREAARSALHSGNPLAIAPDAGHKRIG
ncbi:MAG TPA: DUF1778 domain-containing protein [Advenella sp.]|nr:DUF1778 domain-containing protein [Advenella sp.]